MLDLKITYVPEEKLSGFLKVEKKPDNFSTGFVRMFVLPDARLTYIDTRYDAELRKLGLLEERT